MKQEDKILMLSSTLNWKPENIDYASVNWDELVEKAILHKVAGTLYEPFRDNLNVPVYIFEIMEYLYFGQKMVGRKKIEEFQHVIEELCKNDIKVMILKGIYMVPYVYKDLGLRSFGDMDLLIRTEDIEKACHVLTENGYVRGEYNFYERKLTPYALDNNQQYIGEFQKMNDDLMDECYSIDLNNRLGVDYEHGLLNTDEIWKRSIPFQFGNCTVQCISNEDILIQYCYQTYARTKELKYVKKGREMELRSYMDVRTLIKNTAVDWDIFFSLAEDANIIHDVEYTLYFCHLIFGDVLDSSVLSRIHKEKVLEMDSCAYQQWITEENKGIYKYCTEDFLPRMFDMDRFTFAIGTDF